MPYLPLWERVAEGRVRGAPANSPLTPTPSPTVGRGENGDTLIRQRYFQGFARRVSVPAAPTATKCRKVS